MLHLYCVAERVPSGLPRGVVGLGDGPVLLVEEVDRPQAPTLASLRAHHAVIRAGEREGGCLPFRFGETLDDAALSQAWLAEHPGLAASLARVRGRCEFDLKAPVEPVAEPAPGPGAGTRYLESLRAQARGGDRVAAIASTLHAALPAEEMVIDAPAGALAFLVRVEDADAFAARARNVEAPPHWRWSGPWPVYSFAAKWFAPV